jgi:hypothetical protein
MLNRDEILREMTLWTNESARSGRSPTPSTRAPFLPTRLSPLGMLNWTVPTMSDDILLEARIVGVADVVEAMSSHRPYRPGRGMEPALYEISAARGSIYDSGVVDACLALFRNGYVLPVR